MNEQSRAFGDYVERMREIYEEEAGELPEDKERDWLYERLFACPTYALFCALRNQSPQQEDIATLCGEEREEESAEIFRLFWRWQGLDPRDLYDRYANLLNEMLSMEILPFSLAKPRSFLDFHKKIEAFSSAYAAAISPHKNRL